MRGPLAPITESVADGVWRHAGDLRRGMNIYLVAEQGGGVLAFDAGTKAMVKGVKLAAAELGGLTRVILGHSHPDHRGTAPGLGVPVLCHPDEVADAEGDGGMRYLRPKDCPVFYSRWLYRVTLPIWDGGPVEIADTVAEGDRIGEFEVIHFPGHAPGLIGLWRESDRVALVSDIVYLVDSARLRPLPEGEASVPHPAWAWDHAKAKESLRRLAALEPRVVGAGHAPPLRGDNLRETLERAAAKH